MSGIQSSEGVNGDTMLPGNEIKTNIRVSHEKYELLRDLKLETGKAINALIVEGIDLVLLKHETDLLNAAKKAEQKAGTVKSVLSEIKKK